MSVHGGLFFNHDTRKIRALTIDFASYSTGDVLEINFTYEPAKQKTDYILEFVELSKWLVRNSQIPIFYMGPKLTGAIGKRMPQFQTFLMDTLEDSKAFEDMIQPYYKVNLFGPKQPDLNSGEKAVFELLFEIDPSASDLLLFCAAIAAKSAFPKLKYAELIEKLEGLDLYKSKCEFVRLFCEPSGRRRMGFAAFSKAKSRFAAPNRTVTETLDAIRAQAGGLDKIENYKKLCGT